MVGSFTTQISSNKADAFIVVGIAITIWFFALYYGGGLTIDLVTANHLSVIRVTRMAALMCLATILLWAASSFWVFVLVLILLITPALFWWLRQRENPTLQNYLKAAACLAFTVVFWGLGLTMILLVLTVWQTAALTLGLASLGGCAWLIWRWTQLPVAERRAETTPSFARAAALLAVGVTLIGALIATS